MKRLILCTLVSFYSLSQAAASSTDAAVLKQLQDFYTTCGLTLYEGDNTPKKDAHNLFKLMHDPKHLPRIVPHLTPELLTTINTLAVEHLKGEANKYCRPDYTSQFEDLDQKKHYYTPDHNLLARMVLANDGPYPDGTREDWSGITEEDVYRQLLTMLTPKDGVLTEVPISLTVDDLNATQNLPESEKDETTGLKVLCLLGQGLTSLKGLEAMPDAEKEAIQALYVRGNLLREIPPASLPAFANLYILDLIHNNITVEDGMFDGLPICRLYLGTTTPGRDQHKNNLPKVTNKTFRRLPKLAVLCLPNLDITHVDADAFNGLPALIYVDISQNHVPEEEVTAIERRDITIESDNMTVLTPSNTMS